MNTFLTAINKSEEGFKATVVVITGGEWSGSYEIKASSYKQAYKAISHVIRTENRPL